jgi:6-phosphogluconolactonase (cycloisomerase 2 family)
MLTLLENVPTGGKTPRGFDIGPTGSFFLAANEDSGNIVVFRIDPNSGRLTAGPCTSLFEVHARSVKVGQVSGDRRSFAGV